MNIIGDIAGRFDELMLLVDKMPKGEEIILLGDLNDRGLKTKEVIQWAIDNKIRCVKSNHGQMMIDAYNIWLATGNPHGSWEFNMNGMFTSQDLTVDFHLNGHIHSGPHTDKKETKTDRQFDVGVAANRYRPVSLSEIESWINLETKKKTK